MIAGYFGVDPKRIQTAVQNQWGVAASGDNAESSKGDDKTASRDKNSIGEEEPKPGQFSTLSKIVGGAILLFSATGLFAQLQYALNRAWEVKPDPKRGGIVAFVVKRILSFGMVLVVAFLLLISMVLTTIIDEIVAYVQGGAPEGFSLAVGMILNNVAAFGVATLLFAAMYKALPDAKMAWRDVWIGAAVTALLFVIGKALIGVYLQHTDLSSSWGSAAASMIGVLVWVYYSSLILLFGAEVTQVWASRFGEGIRPAKGAIAVESAA